MPILWPDIAWELILELNKTIFVGEAVRLTDLPAGSWSGSGHLNRGHEAVDASPHPNGSVKASHFDLDINRPPTGGDLTFSWKEGHICTVVLLEVLSQLCHGGGGVQALSVVGGRQSRTRV